jgi:hypothetical protein
MDRSIRCWWAFVFVTCVACAGVSTEVPVVEAQPPATIAPFEGTWLVVGAESARAVVTVQLGDDGSGSIMFLDLDDPSDIESHSVELRVLQREDGGFLSVRETLDEEFKDSGLYRGMIYQRHGESWTYWGLAEYRFLGDNDLVVWIADFEAIERLVTQGRLSARRFSGRYYEEIVLSIDAASLRSLLDGPDRASLFAYRYPLFLQRLDSARSDPERSP